MESRLRAMSRFKAFLVSFEDLCFGNCSNKGRTHGGRLKVSTDLDEECFEVRCGNCTVYASEMKIDSSFKESRDWLELFYDSRFAPPKLFHIMMQWIVCSSIHLVHFVSRVQAIAKEHGFVLASVPISILFPQPAPDWVWSSNNDLNFDRLPFLPRRRISFPRLPGNGSERLYARLLTQLLQPPLSMLFLFSANRAGFKCVESLHIGTEAVAGTSAPAQATNQAQNERKPEQQTAEQQVKSVEVSVFGRQKGWVLVDKDCLCMASVREEGVYWSENWCGLCDILDGSSVDRLLQRSSDLRREFFRIVETLVAECTAEATVSHVQSCAEAENQQEAQARPPSKT